MTDCVTVELEIIQEELKKAGVEVPVFFIRTWSIELRAEVEQWAIRKKWYLQQHWPAPVGHDTSVPYMPYILKCFE